MSDVSDISAPKRLRISLRSALLAMALVGIVLAFTIRVIRFENLARFHDQQAEDQRDYFYFRLPIEQLGKLKATDAERAAGYRLVFNWHTRMASQYRQAIWRPWLSVRSELPEPPDPEPQLPKRKYPPASRVP